MGMDVRVSNCGCYALISSTSVYLFNNYLHLLQENNAESGFLDDHPLDINIDKYTELERHGLLRTFLITEYAAVVGYCTLLFSPFLHHDSIKNAWVDTIFIKKPARNLNIFRSVLNSVENICKEHGVNHLCISSMPQKSIDKLLKRYGFVQKEVIFYKELC